MFSLAALRLPALAALATALAWAGHYLLWPLDNFLHDTGALSAKVESRDDIAILGIDEEFMAGRHPSVVPRDRLARLIDALGTAKPRCIVVDVWLDSRFEDKSDALLRGALLRAKQHGVPVYLGDLPARDGFQKDKNQTGLSAHGSVIPYFRDAATATGDVNFTLDGDGLVRALSPFRERQMYSIARLAAFPERRQLKTGAERDLAFRMHTERIPLAWHYRIPHTPAMQYVKQPFLAPLLEGKTVFIGATYPRSHDYLATPRDLVQSKPMYGVEVLAAATATLRDGAPRRTHEKGTVQLWTAVLAFALAWPAAALAWRGAGVALLTAVLGVAGLMGLAFYSANDVVMALGHRYWPPSWPLLAVLFSCGLAVAGRSREQARELKLVRDTFGAYVGDEVLEALGNRMPELGGELRQIAVLFCDIRGYSALAERMQNDPARLMNALNEHFDPLVEALKARGAYADNYVGDLVMALFGAPVSQGFATNVRNAVAAAHDFVRLVDERNALRRAAGEEPIEVGIGLHCGEAVVGNLGSSKKIHYTAIGDVVNIASRVESSTRKYGVPLLVTEEIVQAAGGEWEFVEETTVKGRTTPVRLYKASE